MKTALHSCMQCLHWPATTFHHSFSWLLKQFQGAVDLYSGHAISRAAAVLLHRSWQGLHRCLCTLRDCSSCEDCSTQLHAMPALPSSYLSSVLHVEHWSRVRVLLTADQAEPSPEQQP